MTTEENVKMTKLEKLSSCSQNDYAINTVGKNSISKDLRAQCSELICFKRDHWNRLGALEHNIEYTLPKLDSVVNDAKKIYDRIERIPQEAPDNPSSLKVENDKLKYLIAKSTTIFAKVDAMLGALGEDLSEYTSLTAQANVGLDARLKRILKDLCSEKQSDCDQAHRNDEYSDESLSG